MCLPVWRGLFRRFQLNKKRVLVVDDSVTNRVSYGRVFEQFGFEVVQASGGANAVEIYEEDPSFDLVVVDIDMPGLNGFTSARMIRQYQVAKRPYIVGVGSSPEDSEKAVKAGMDFFVVRTEVKQMVQAGLGGLSLVKGGR